ncbi:hypothetical protein HMPREF1147_2338 [Selenomonas sp. FOBRC9]|nr:hypothetical protein HMPREF1147_2338 [Selenomonas sp. FOBRC9]
MFLIFIRSFMALWKPCIYQGCSYAALCSFCIILCITYNKNRVNSIKTISWG